MTVYTEDQLDAMAQAFKLMNKYFMVPMWRLGLGPFLNSWPEVGGRTLVLVHKGRKSGNEYRTPVNYADIDDNVYCVAAMGPRCDWYKNLMANPQIEVWLPEGWYRTEAIDISETEKRLPLIREVLIASGFAATTFGGIDPHTASDDELDAATADYRLINLRRGELLEGPGGPDDLAWLWWVVGIVLALWLLRPRQRQKA